MPRKSAARAGKICGIAGVSRMPCTRVWKLAVDGDGADVPGLSSRRRHRRLLRQADRVGSRARRDRWNAPLHRDSPRRQRRMGSVSRRLRDRIEVAAGLRDKASRLPPARLPDPVQPVAIGVGQLLAAGRRAWVTAHGYLAVPSRAWRCGVPDHVRAVSHEPAVVRGRRRGAGGRDVPRGGHQLRNVPWSLARSRRAAQGRRHTAHRPRRLRQSAFDACPRSDTWRCARSATRSRPCTTRSRAAL